MAESNTTRTISLDSGSQELRGYFEWVVSVVAKARYHDIYINQIRRIAWVERELALGRSQGMMCGGPEPGG
jgi:hypothetical protein